MENAPARMVRSKDTVRYSIRRTLRSGVTVQPALHTRFLTLPFVAKPGVEALNEAVLPGTAPLNVGRLGPDGSDPVLHGLGDEFRSVVGSDVFGHATQNELIGQ